MRPKPGASSSNALNQKRKNGKQKLILSEKAIKIIVRGELKRPFSGKDL